MRCIGHCSGGLLSVKGKKKKSSKGGRERNIKYQTQTLILPLMLWSRLATMQLKIQLLKQVSMLGRVTCINWHVSALLQEIY